MGNNTWKSSATQEYITYFWACNPFFSVQYVVIYNTFREWCSKRYANQYSFLDHIGLGGGGKSWAKNQTVLFKLFFLFLIINFLITVGNQFFFYNVCIVFQSLGSLLLRFFWKDIAAYYITCCIFFKLKYIRTKQFFKHFYDNIIWLKLKSGNTLRVCVPDLG